MASVFKPKIKGKESEKWFILYTDQHGKRRKKIGYISKRDTERLAMKLEERAARIRDGLDDPAAERYRDYERRPLSEHLADWTKALAAKGTARQARRALHWPREATRCLAGGVESFATSTRPRTPSVQPWLVSRRRFRSGRQAFNFPT